MDLATHRKALGLSLAQCAQQLGVRSKGLICDFERGAKTPSLRLAYRIEKWSGGKLRAADLNPEAAEIARLRPGKAA